MVTENPRARVAVNGYGLIGKRVAGPAPCGSLNADLRQVSIAGVEDLELTTHLLRYSPVPAIAANVQECCASPTG